MGKSEKRVKSARINALRKQYDTFLEEDKKRRQRNDYILGSLDKISSCTTVIQIRHRHVEVGPMASGNRLSLFAEARPSYDVQMSQLQPNQQHITPKYTDESMLINELSKKFILIPKLHFNPALVESVKPSELIDNNDWKNKYKILEKLKHDEKGHSGEITRQENDTSFNSGFNSVLQKHELPTKDYSHTSDSFHLKNSKTENKDDYNQENSYYKDNLKLVNDSKVLKGNHKEYVSNTMNMENFSEVGNDKIVLLKKDDIPTTLNTYGYECKKDIDKEDIHIGPQTKPFTYEYTYKKETDEYDDKPNIENTEDSLSITNQETNVEKRKELDALEVKDKLKGFVDNISEKTVGGSDKNNTLNTVKKLNRDITDLEINKHGFQTTRPESDIVSHSLEQTKLNPGYAETNIVQHSQTNANSFNHDLKEQLLTKQEGLTQQKLHNDSTINISEQLYVHDTDATVAQSDPSLVYDASAASNDHKHLYQESAIPENQLVPEISVDYQQNQSNLQEHYNSNEMTLLSTHQQGQIEYDGNQLNDLKDDHYSVLQRHINQEQQEYENNLIQEFGQNLQDYNSNKQQLFHHNQQEVDPNQQEVDPNLHQQVNTNHEEYYQQFDPNQQEYDPNQPQPFDENQQEYDLTQQQPFDQNQQEYDTNQQQQGYDHNQQQHIDQNQQDYDPNQHQLLVQNEHEFDTSEQQHINQNEQGYDPNQQNYDPNQVNYDQTQLEHDSDKVEYDPNQEGYEPSQQQYDENQAGYDIDQQGLGLPEPHQEYVANDQEYDTNQQAYNTTLDGLENNQQEYAVCDGQNIEPLHQEYEPHYESEKQQIDPKFQVMQQDHSVNQQLEFDARNDLGEHVPQEVLQEPKLQLPEQKNKPSNQKMVKEKKEAENKVPGANTIKKIKDKPVEQSKVSRKLRA